ncbi:MAG: glycosyltransferase family 2 protein [archaeon]
MVDVSISIASWNTRELTKQCIESIYMETKKHRFEIIVIENGSTDGSAEMIKKNFPEVILIENKENVGFGGAHNQAFGVSKRRYNLILNSDTIILDRAIDKMVDFLEKNSDVAVVTCLLLNPDKTVQHFVDTFPTIRNQFLYRIPYFERHLKGEVNFDYSRQQEVENFTGACYTIRRKVIDEIGTFDKDLFAYMEETTWFYKMKKKGLKLIYYPEPKIIHYGGASTKTWEQKHIWFYMNMLTFFKKNYGYPYLVLVKLYVSLSNILELCKVPFLWILPKTKRIKKERDKSTLAWTLLKINLFKSV